MISKLITSLKEADSLSDEQDLGFLQNLLQSKELNALVNVHSKVAKINKDDRIAPLLSTSMQVGCLLLQLFWVSVSPNLTSICLLQVLLEVLELLAPRCHISPLCKEIFHLLQTPHLQVRRNHSSAEFYAGISPKSSSNAEYCCSKQQTRSTSVDSTFHIDCKF